MKLKIFILAMLFCLPLFGGDIKYKSIVAVTKPNWVDYDQDEQNDKRVFRGNLIQIALKDAGCQCFVTAKSMSKQTSPDFLYNVNSENCKIQSKDVLCEPGFSAVNIPTTASTDFQKEDIGITEKYKICIEGGPSGSAKKPGSGH